MRALIALLALLPTLATALTLDAATGGNNFAVTTPVALSHTIGSGSNRILLVGVSEESAATPNAPTYNSTTMNLCTSSYVEESTNSVRWYYLLETDLPTTGAYNVAITFGAGTGRGGLTAISYEDAEQVAPTCGITGSATSGTSLTTGSFSSGDVAVAHYNFNVASSSFTPGAGQTEFSDVNTTAYTHGASYKAISGSTTMSATTAASITTGGVISVVTVAAAASGPTVTLSDATPDIDTTVTATLSGAFGAGGNPATVTFASGDTVSCLSATSTTCDFPLNFSALVASGDLGTTKVESATTITVTNGTETSQSTAINIQIPASGYDIVDLTCTAGTDCSDDSEAISPMTTGDDCAIKVTSGTLDHLSTECAPVFSSSSFAYTVARFDESVPAWLGQEDVSVSAPVTCMNTVASVVQPSVRESVKSQTCAVERAGQQ